jgi:ribosomal protein S18 acetylase RimI-like enzyme
MSSPLISRAKLTDLPKLQELSSALLEFEHPLDPHGLPNWSFSEHGKKYLTKRIRGRNGVCFVAKVNGEIVGYTTGGVLKIQNWRPFRRAEMENLFIREEYRRQGLGPLLINEFLKWCAARKVERVIVYTLAKNDRAVKFYEANEFEKYVTILERTLL